MSPDSHRSPQDHVRIQLLGGFGVTIGGRAIPEHEFGRRIARQLLKLIAIQSNASLHREQILDTLWPHLEPEAGAAQLYKAIHHVRRAFATVVPKSTADSLFSLKEQVLTLEAEELSVDAHLFLEDAHAKDAAGAATLLELYRGDLLPADRYEEWTLELREELTQRASDLRLLLGEQCLREERWDDAEVRFREVLEQDEVSEAAWLGWMQVLARRGDRGRLKKELTKCRQTLTEFTGESPDKVFENQVTALLELARESATQDQEPSGATLRKSESTDESGGARGFPDFATPLVGRDEELADLKKRLGEEDHRLLVLVGPGGVGKTRLAVQTGETLASQFAQGSVYLELSPAMPGGLLVTQLLNALGLKEEDAGKAKERLVDYLRPRSLLLVLDNAEHLTEASDVLSELLVHAPQTKILATSRQRLGLREEQVIRVTGLKLPSERTSAAINSFPAGALFHLNVMRSNPEHIFSSEESDAARNICELTEGHPLALELAATWAGVLSVSQILGELKQGIGVLAQSEEGFPERHESMSAVFEQSWNLLSETQRAAMSQLSLLTGVFGREAASRVANVGLPELKGLVDKSFLNRNSEGGFRIHELLRQFVSGKLKASPNALKEAEARLREYYASRLQERVPDLQGAGQKAGLDELALEFENVLVAWDLAVRDQEFDALSKMVEGLWLVCELRGWFTEALGAVHRASQCVRDGTDVSPYLKASLLASSGRCYLRLHQLEQAERDLERARIEAEPAEKPPLYAFVLNNLGLLELQKSNPDQAYRWFEQSLKLYSGVDNVWGVANVVNNLGDALQLQGRAEEAQDHYQRSLRIFRNLSDQRGLVTVLRNLGRLRESQNEFEEARVCFEECVSAARDLKDRYMLSRSLRDLALVASKTKEWEHAGELLSESQSVAEAMGDPLEMAHCTFAQATLEQAQGHRDSARGLAREALRRINRLSDSSLKPQILGFLDNLSS